MILIETIKQLLDEIFVICRIINVEVRVISRAEGDVLLYISSGENHKLNLILVLS